MSDNNGPPIPPFAIPVMLFPNILPVQDDDLPEGEDDMAVNGDENEGGVGELPAAQGDVQDKTQEQENLDKLEFPTIGNHKAQPQPQQEEDIVMSNVQDKPDGQIEVQVTRDNNTSNEIVNLAEDNAAQSKAQFQQDSKILDEAVSLIDDKPDTQSKAANKTAGLADDQGQVERLPEQEGTEIINKVTNETLRQHRLRLSFAIDGKEVAVVDNYDGPDEDLDEIDAEERVEDVVEESAAAQLALKEGSTKDKASESKIESEAQASSQAVTTESISESKTEGQAKPQTSTLKRALDEEDQDQDQRSAPFYANKKLRADVNRPFIRTAENFIMSGFNKKGSNEETIKSLKRTTDLLNNGTRGFDSALGKMRSAMADIEQAMLDSRTCMNNITLAANSIDNTIARVRKEDFVSSARSCVDKVLNGFENRDEYTEWFKRRRYFD